MMSDSIRLGIFLLFAVMTVGSAAVVAFARSIVHCIFALLFTLFGVAGLYGVLQADFLAATQVMIYVGGILVLLLFGVMLTHKVATLEMKNPSFQRGWAGFICVSLLAVMLAVIFRTPWPVVDRPPVHPTPPAIGMHLMTDFLLPFEVISVLLFAVLVAAALMARREARR
jgi:NAD(P)H-quinone oxidoreductase subunit 6